MDIEFQKALFKIELESIFEKYGEKKAKELLKNCIDFKKIEDKKIEKIIYQESPICKICRSTELNFSGGEEICNMCGAVVGRSMRQSVAGMKNIEYLPRTENKIDLLIDGKNIKVDLNKITLYTLKQLTPQQRLYRSGLQSIEEKLPEILPNYSERVLNTILSLYWNITIYYDNNPNIKPSFKPTDTKKIYQALSVYYGLLFNDVLINPYKILNVFDVTMANMEYYNKILRVILKDTDYEIKLNIEEPINKISDEKISNMADDLLEKLVQNKVIKTPISKEAYGAAVFYVAFDILKLKYTLSQVKTELGLSNVSKIRENYGKIKIYFGGKR